MSLGALLLGFYYLCLTPFVFPIKRVGVAGELRQTAVQDLKKTVLEHTKRGFFGFYDRFLERDLLRHPWIHSVSVKRIWPDAVEIKLTEHAIFASYLDKELIDTHGTLLLREVVGNDLTKLTLPQFVGPRNKISEMTQKYKRVSEFLERFDLKIQRWVLTEDGSWEANLNNGIIIILGKSEIEQRLHRFELAYPKILRNHLSDLAYVDLRYKRGLALGWKSGAKPNHKAEVIR